MKSVRLRIGEPSAYYVISIALRQEKNVLNAPQKDCFIQARGMV
jgi:hypothetical protein